MSTCNILGVVCAQAGIGRLQGWQRDPRSTQPAPQENKNGDAIEKRTRDREFLYPVSSIYIGDPRSTLVAVQAYGPHALNRLTRSVGRSSCSA